MIKKFESLFFRVPIFDWLFSLPAGLFHNCEMKHLASLFVRAHFVRVLIAERVYVMETVFVIYIEFSVFR